jgi:hypothetical protein
MYATDFLFDENRLSDFGYMIGSFNGETETATGGNIEFTVVKSPSNDRFNFYGSQLNEQLVWNFSILKNPCQNENEEMYFTQYEESQLSQWLLKQDGFRFFQFDQEGYEDVYYRVQINMLPHQINGRTIGFDLTVTSDCGYGYSEEIEKTFIFNNSKSIRLDVHSDTNSYILPYFTIYGKGNFYISNNSDLSQNYSNGKDTEFTDVNGTIILDSENDIIGLLENEGKDNEQIVNYSSPKNFNWYFLRLVNGVNNIATNSTSDVTLKIKYREPRRVII